MSDTDETDQFSIQVLHLAYGRSGDKGNNANIGLIARKPEYYALLERHVTAAAVKAHFGELCQGRVERFALPNLNAFNFILHEVLDGGGTVSLRIDAQGKTLAAALQRMTIELLPSEAKLADLSRVS